MRRKGHFPTYVARLGYSARILLSFPPDHGRPSNLSAQQIHLSVPTDAASLRPPRVSLPKAFSTLPLLQGISEAHT